ncbi:ATP-binding cassette sub-family D member 3-like [Symsagittifera roscoffensis]|uniref:ATP-binding cassette sub-family D member 3-like n=1 Tax=Symsagittifera roscoffensis TaxID=84072 RepID=UPI00307C72CB
MSEIIGLDLTPSQAGVAVTGVTAAIYVILNRVNNMKLKALQSNQAVVCISDKSTGKERKVAVDQKFFASLVKLYKVCCPGVFCKEFGLTLSVAGSLIARTWLDILSIDNATRIESAIVAMDQELFRKHITFFITLMPFLAITNNVLKYSLSSLQLAFRVRLTKYLYDLYLQKLVYYKMGNLDGRIANADQLLTQDVEKFSQTITDLYSNISKPILDIAIYATKLTRVLGAHTPLAMIGYMLLSGGVLTRLRKPVSKMTVEEQRLEGEYRFVNSRLITYSEEIAFYEGSSFEKMTIEKVFNKLVTHLKSMILFRFSMGYLDNIVAKYVATLVGFYIVSRPFLASKSRFQEFSHSARLEDYYKSGRMLLKMAEAMGRVALAGRELSRLAGLTSRVCELTEVLEDLKSDKFVRQQVASSNTSAPASKDLSPDAKKLAGTENNDEEGQELTLASFGLTLQSRGHTIISDGHIKFDNVPLIAPNGSVLIESLNFEVRHGQNVLVRGSNGCGKSSLFRVLGGLWPVFSGTVIKPVRRNLFYIPQKPYMTLGTFRDQLIYPDSHEDMRRKHVKDADLEVIIEQANLTRVLQTHGWNKLAEWIDVLSGGEKQRMAMARLFYHRPQWAILDECSSQISVDTECQLYDVCAQKGISLITVSHRDTLWQHHQKCLKFTDDRQVRLLDVVDGTEPQM